jgi:hypothetical protein
MSHAKDATLSEPAGAGANEQHGGDGDEEAAISVEGGNTATDGGGGGEKEEGGRGHGLLEESGVGAQAAGTLALEERPGDDKVAAAEGVGASTTDGGEGGGGGGSGKTPATTADMGGNATTTDGDGGGGGDNGAATMSSEAVMSARAEAGKATNGNAGGGNRERDRSHEVMVPVETKEATTVHCDDGAGDHDMNTKELFDLWKQIRRRGLEYAQHGRGEDTPQVMMADQVMDWAIYVKQFLHTRGHRSWAATMKADVLRRERKKLKALLTADMDWINLDRSHVIDKYHCAACGDRGGPCRIDEPDQPRKLKPRIFPTIGPPGPDGEMVDFMRENINCAEESMGLTKPSLGAQRATFCSEWTSDQVEQWLVESGVVRDGAGVCAALGGAWRAFYTLASKFSEIYDTTLSQVRGDREHLRQLELGYNATSKFVASIESLLESQSPESLARMGSRLDPEAARQQNRRMAEDLEAARLGATYMDSDPPLPFPSSRTHVGDAWESKVLAFMVTENILNEGGQYGFCALAGGGAKEATALLEAVCEVSPDRQQRVCVRGCVAYVVEKR